MLLDAAVTGNVKQVSKILMGGECPPDAPELIRALHSACANGNEELASLLIEHGVNVNARDERGKSALECAVAALETHIIKLLILKGAEVNAMNNDGYTPLHQAIESEVDEDMYPSDGIRKRPMGEIVKLLIESGANVNAKTLEGETPLHFALSLNHKAAQVILREHGAI